MRIGEKFKFGKNIFDVLQIKEGGMGVVYICHNPRLGYRAFKTFKSSYDNNAIKDAFIRESELWIKLGEFRFITKAISVDFIEGQPFIQMEYVRGPRNCSNLSELIRERKVSGEEFLYIILNILKGLLYVTKRMEKMNVEFVHGDLKPQNILIAETVDTAIFKYGYHSLPKDNYMFRFIGKLTDFGIAKCYALNDNSLMISSEFKKISGTPPYMSPEQCEGKKLTVQSDIYSMGCIMYETLCGRHIFAVNSVEQFIKSHIAKQPVNINTYNNELKKEVSEMIMQCLEKSPDKRPSLQQLIGQLEVWFGKKPEEIRKEEEEMEDFIVKLGFDVAPELRVWVRLMELGKLKEATTHIVNFAQKKNVSVCSLKYKLADLLIYDEHNFDKSKQLALDLLHDVVKLWPTNPDVLRLMGYLYSENGAEKSAEQAYKESIRLIKESIVKTRDEAGRLFLLEIGLIDSCAGLLAIYRKRNDINSTSEIFRFVSDVVGNKSSFSLREHLAIMFEASGDFMSAINFYKMNYWATWDVFRILAQVKMNDEALKFLIRYTWANSKSSLKMINVTINPSTRESVKIYLGFTRGLERIGHLSEALDCYYDFIETFSNKDEQIKLADLEDEMYLYPDMRGETDSSQGKWNENMFNLMLVYARRRIGRINNKIGIFGIIVEVASPVGMKTMHVFKSNRTIYIGRQDSSHIAIDADPLVSRQHAKISIEGDLMVQKLMLSDLESKNGTFLNEKLVESPISLKEGDLVRFGSSTLRIKSLKVER